MADHFEKDRLHHQAIAGEYDDIVNKPREIANDILFGRFEDLVLPGECMLDAATGTGHMVLRFADRFNQVIAVDHSAEMLSQAAHKVNEKSWSHVRFVHSDLLDYISAASPDSFDFITCVGFLHHVQPEHVPATVLGLAQLLRKGGRLLIAEPMKIPESNALQRINGWNSRSLAAKASYSVSVEEPDEAPLDADLVLGAVQSANLTMVRLHRSFEVFPHNDPPSLRDRMAIRYLNLRYGRFGNVLTLMARR